MLCVAHDVLFGPQACQRVFRDQRQDVAVWQASVLLRSRLPLLQIKFWWCLPCEAKMSHDLELCGVGMMICLPPV